MSKTLVIGLLAGGVLALAGYAVYKTQQNYTGSYTTPAATEILASAAIVGVSVWAIGHIVGL